MKKPFNTSSLKPTSQAPAANHHDIFFKSFFSDPGLALDIFKLVFSKQELNSLNLKQLKNEKDSFPDKRADLVFSVPLKNQPKVQLKILFLLEHKSHYDAQLFSQLLYYQSLLHQQNLKQYGRPLPAVPVVFYHGKQPWRWKKSFQEVFWPSERYKIPVWVRKSMLEYRVRLIDLQDQAKVAKVFKGSGFERTQAALYLMHRAWGLKEKRGPERRKILEALLPMLKGLSGKGGKKKREDLLLSVVEYMRSLGVSGSLWEELEREALNRGFLNKGGVMNIREYIKQKGVKEGWQKGLKQGQQELILKMLDKKLDLSVISEVTGLPMQEIKKLKNGS